MTQITDAPPVEPTDDDAPAVAAACGAPASHGRRWLRHLSVVSCLAVATVLPLLRQRGAHSWHTIWAEDGMYVTDAHSSGFVETLFRGYAGYAQFVPRLMAAGTCLLPVRFFDLYLAVASTAMAALIAAFVYRSMAGWIPSTVLRLVLAAFVVVGPTLGFENTANVTNLNWILWFAGFCAVVSQARGRLDTAARCLVVILAVTSTPLTLIFVPLAVVVLVWRRRGADLAVLVAYGVGAVLQGLAIVFTNNTSPTPPSHLGDLLPLFATRVAGPFVFGEGAMIRWWPRLGTGLGWAGLAALAALIAALWFHARRDARLYAAVALAYSVLTYTVPVWLRGTSSIGVTTELFNQSGARYTVVPTLLLVTGVVVLIGQSAWWPRLRAKDASRAGRVVAAMLAICCVAVLATSFEMTTPRSGGPTWWASTEATARTCRELGVEIASAAITPPGWLVILPCSRFTEG